MVKDLIKAIKHATSDLFIGIGNTSLILFTSDCVIVVGNYEKIKELFMFPRPEHILKYFGKADFDFLDGYLRSRINKIEGKIVGKDNFEKFSNKLDHYFTSKAVWNQKISKDDFLGRTSVFKIINNGFVRGNMDDNGKFIPTGSDIPTSSIHDASYLKNIWRELCETEKFIEFECIDDGQLRAKLGNYIIIVGKRKG